MVREEEEPKHVPMGMAQLAAIAIKKGHQIQIYDHNAWRADDDQVVEVLKSDKWDIVGFGGITTSYGSLKKLIKLSRKILPNTIISLGGGVLTSLPKEIMTWLLALSNYRRQCLQTLRTLSTELELWPFKLEMVHILLQTERQ